MSPLNRAGKAVAEGDLDLARRLLSDVTTPEDDLGRLCLALLWAECGDAETARRLAGSIADAAVRARAEAALCNAAPDSPNAGVLESTDDPFEVVTHTHAVRRPENDETVALFLRWFGGRRDLYAAQWVDGRRRRTGYRPIENPLTARVAQEHLAASRTIGQYLLFPDATVSFAVIDLDLSAGALEAMRAGHPGAVAAEHSSVRGLARKLVDAAASLGLPLFAEDSGGRGMHLWLFLEPRRPARAARDILAQVVMAAGAQPPDVGVELFPKQDRAGPRGLSSLVKLPLGIHLGSGRRCPLLDEGFRPVKDDLEALRRLRSALPAHVDALLGRRVLPLPAPEAAPVGEAPALPSRSNPRGLAEEMRLLPSGKPEREASDRVLGGCGILGAISRRAHEDHRLAPEEARAITYTVGLIGAEGGVARGILAAANASTKELDRVRRGLPSPMGCAKLRRMDPGEGRACLGCPGARGAPYATPALFAVGSVAPTPPLSAPFAPFLDVGAAAVESPIDAVTEMLRRIDERLERIERREGTAGS